MISLACKKGEVYWCAAIQSSVIRAWLASLILLLLTCLPCDFRCECLWYWGSLKLDALLFHSYIWPFDSFFKTYVLDVHPFNPRIAMSAGYDGRTIVWDVSFKLLHAVRSIFVSSLLLMCFHILLIVDMGRYTNSDIWNCSFQVGWWEVFIVSSLPECLT